MRYDPSITFHAILGFWELRNFRFLTQRLVTQALVRPDGVICDLGANIGTYTLWFAKHLVSKGTVHAFEPAPAAVSRLRDHLVLNGIANVKVVELACTDTVGQIEFYVASDHYRSSILQGWAGAGGTSESPSRITVGSTTIDAYFSQAPGGWPDLIKMDIEGGGITALRACHRCVEAKRPFFLIESHTPEEDRTISDLVVQHRYHAYRLTDGTWAEAPTEIFPHPRGIWGSLFLCPAEQQNQF